MSDPSASMSASGLATTPVLLDICTQRRKGWGREGSVRRNSTAGTRRRRRCPTDLGLVHCPVAVYQDALWRREVSSQKKCRPVNCMKSDKKRGGTCFELRGNGGSRCRPFLHRRQAGMQEQTHAATHTQSKAPSPLPRMFISDLLMFTNIWVPTFL